MPKIFNESEKERITSRIIAAAREIFWKHGFNKTSISAITSRVGIAAGTFYNFFVSKEMVFFEILMDVTHVRREQLALFQDERDPFTQLEEYLETCFAYMSTDPFFDIFYREKMHERLMAKVPQEEFAKLMQEDIAVVTIILNHFKSRGFLTTLTVEDLIFHFTTIHMAIYMKGEIGVTDNSRYIEQQIKILVNGLKYI